MKTDMDELREQISDLTALLEDLRPVEGASLISRLKLRLLAAASGDPDLMHHAGRADTDTLFWQMPDGTILEQHISVVRATI